MAAAKTATLTTPIELKQVARTAAAAKHGSIANMVAIMIRDDCEWAIRMQEARAQPLKRSIANAS